jgi:acyl-CoA reductase-like NAD-dependent aldehyde dehydrogenase|eukprot:COSAG01_NODE_3056_length_6658_cov_3.019210_7_plen_159_part_00
MEESSARLQAQVADAVSKGARLLAGGEACQDAAGRGRFFAPTLLADCTHEMEVMQQETFGPILPVAAVDSDDVAVERINDSDYGLTAAIFSPSAERVRSVGERLEVGTVFANRCDYLDPALPWGGRKDTGKGVSLSSFGFNSYFKLKGYNLKGIYTHT